MVSVYSKGTAISQISTQIKNQFSCQFLDWVVILPVKVKVRIILTQDGGFWHTNVLRHDDVIKFREK